MGCCGEASCTGRSGVHILSRELDCTAPQPTQRQARSSWCQRTRLCLGRAYGDAALCARQEALWRSAAFADAGADMLFIDALESEDEMRAFCRLAGAARVPKVLMFAARTAITAPRTEGSFLRKV